MSQLINDSGFVSDDLKNIVPLTLASDTAPDHLDSVLSEPFISIDFPTSSDGRGFTLARLLRLRGFQGRLRAIGHIIADQYAMARRSGFDDVEIHDEIAQRQGEDQWLMRANWQAHDYQSRLKAAASTVQTPLGAV